MERVTLVILFVFMFAGLTGLDGGKPPVLDEVGFWNASARKCCSSSLALTFCINLCRSTSILLQTMITPVSFSILPLEVKKLGASLWNYTRMWFLKLPKISVHCALVKRVWERVGQSFITRALFSIALFQVSCARYVSGHASSQALVATAHSQTHFSPLVGRRLYPWQWHRWRVNIRHEIRR